MRDTAEESKLFTSVEIEINTSCNRRCSHCPNSIYDRGLIENEQLMPTNLFHKIIDELAEINFSGRISPHFYGEPLLDQRLVRFMTYIKRCLSKVKIVIFTNGDYLTFDKYMELVEAGVDEFIVTQHDQWMPIGIKDLFKHFELVKTFPVPIHYLILDDSTPLYNRGGVISINTAIPLPNCALWNFGNVTIDYEGNVILCCSDYQSSIRFGNIKKKKLLDIWYDERYKIIRKNLRTMNFYLPLCIRCTENIEPKELKNAYIKMMIDFREIPDRITFLNDPIESGSLMEIPYNTQFSVETIKSEKIKDNSDLVLIISGWAIDSSTGTPAAAVFITFDTGQEFRAYYPVTRPDVAEYYNNESLKDSGFAAIIPSGELPPGKRTFRFKIVNHNKTGFYRPTKQFSLPINSR